MKDLKIFDENGKRLHIDDVIAVLLPKMDEVNQKLSQLIESDFDDHEEVEKREYSFGFRRCWFWLKHEVGD